MMNLHESEQYTAVGFLGIWGEEWQRRALLARQAERYCTWLRAQGRSRDEAADLAVRFLAAHPPSNPHWLTPPGTPTIH